MSELLKELETEETFRVDDDQKAEWCLQKIREANEEKERWFAFYDEQKRKVAETCDLTVNNMTEMLRSFFDSVPHKATKTQESYSLPSGKLVVKQQEPEYERDDESVLAWLKDNSGEKYIKVKESLDWAGLKKTLTVCGETVADENGEVIPGIKAIEREPVFKVEVK